MSKLPKSVAELDEPTEYLQVVLNTPLQWVLRWGQSVVLLLILMLLALGWLIRYPDRIPAQIVITTPHPPLPVVARMDGPMARLLVQDHDFVRQGALLAVIQSAAQYEQVLRLKETLNSFDATVSSEFSNTLSLDSTYSLGPLQEAYAKLQKAEQDYRLHRQITSEDHQRRAIERQLQRYQDLLIQQQNQQELLRRQKELAEIDYRRHQGLHASQTIADKTLEEQEQVWLEAQESYEAVGTALSHTRVQIAELKREWHKFRDLHTLQEEKLRSALRSATEQMRSDIHRWEEQYFLYAPQSGYVSLFDVRSEQQFAKAGQTVMSIVPNESQPVIGQLRVPIQNSGKLAQGQSVRIYLDNYPYQQYGTLSGMVETISLLPQQNQYHVTISFPQGLTTQYHHTISFQQQLQGRAEIITDELRLLERIFYSLRAATDSFHL